jgi:uncharacterized protein (DUF111 family)
VVWFKDLRGNVTILARVNGYSEGAGCAGSQVKHIRMSARIAYFDCFSGISGDMVLGALVDAGADLRTIEADLRRLGLEGGSISAEKAKRGAIAATRVKVATQEQHPDRGLSIIVDRIEGPQLPPFSTAAHLVFRETTTTGGRTHQVRRKTLERESVKVQTPCGEVRVKVARLNGSILNATPEYEDCQRIAAQRDIPLQQVIAAATFAYQKNSQLRDAAAGGTRT